MKTILVPVDFSLTSSNALQYIADLNEDIAIGRIILLKTHYVSVYSHIITSAEYGQSNAELIEQERNDVENQLRSVGQDLRKKCGTDTKIEVAVSELPILRAINQVVKEQAPDLLLVGSDAGGYESHLGEYIIGIAQTSTIPVLIIPSGSHYRKIESVLVPCNLESVSQLSLIQKLHRIQLLLNPELIILNVDPGLKYQKNETFYKDQLKEHLGDYRYELYFSDEKNAAKGILNFARQNPAIQLIVALPGKHSFFYKLTHSSINEALTLNSHLPVLILKENNSQG